ncbi:neurofilament heavy polypeptide [Drosophila albomicans]|uniref:Neurofilament heavy polypeptide n=1 Tax=Drosophila albomicans TaxID=7291 RepID=A0A6P8WL94_DROAB|nr:neurofilament heavy polypeptide [Drosophila albomicans]
MHLTKGTFLVLTLCLSCSDIWATPTFGLVEGLWNGLGSATHGIIDGFKNATKDGVDLTKNTLEDLHNTKSNFIKGALGIAANLTKAISDSLLGNLKDLTAQLEASLAELESLVARERNLIKRKALQEALDALKLLHSTAIQLKADLVVITEKINGTIAVQLQVAIVELKVWADGQLKRVDECTAGAGLAEATEVINALVVKYVKILEGSIEELLTLKAVFELEVNNAIEKQAKLAKELIAQMKRCSGLLAIRCQLALADLTQQVLAAANELKALQQRGQQLIEAGVYASAQIKLTLIELGKEKLKIEIIIDVIIEKYATTTSSSSTAASTTAASTTAASTTAASTTAASTTAASSTTDSSTAASTTEESSSSSEAESSSASDGSGDNESTSESQAPGGDDSTSESQAPGGDDSTSESQAPGGDDSTSESQAPGGDDSTSESQAPGGDDSTSESQAPGGDDSTSESQAPGGDDSTSESQAPGGDDSTSESQAPSDDSSTGASDTDSTSESEPSGGDDSTSESEAPSDESSTGAVSAEPANAESTTRLGC